MRNKTSLAIIIFSMMMLQTNANAFWLDIVKEFVVGGIKTVVMPKKIFDGKPNPPEPIPPCCEENRKSEQPPPEDIFQALRRLESICNQDFANNIPCSIGIGESLSIGMARDKAIAKARVELARTMKAYVETKANIEESSNIENIDENKIFKEAENYLANSKLSAEQLIIGSQAYLSYTYIDEKTTEINNGRTVYVTTVVMVINKGLFGKGLEDVAKGKPLGEQIINESKKGILDIVRNAIKNI